MNIKTKYKLNQKVWIINQKRRKEWILCDACNGIGNIILRNKEVYSCPICYNRKGEYKYFEERWEVEGELTLGKVEASLQNIVPDGMFDNRGHYETGRTIKECRYMAYETGVGSGTCYYEEKLFPTLESAQTECDKRNLTGEKLS